MSEFSERRILKKARILGSDLKIPKKNYQNAEDRIPTFSQF